MHEASSPPTPDSDVGNHPALAAALAAELRREAVREALRERDLRRYRGVCWSGLSPSTHPPRSHASLVALAQARVEARTRHAADPTGRLLGAVQDIEGLARQTAGASDQIRSTLSRAGLRERDLLDRLLADIEACAQGVARATAKARAVLGDPQS